MRALARIPDRWIARTQGAYWMTAGLWPVLNLRTFASVTGPKPEGWLARAVGSMMTLVGATLLLGSRRRELHPEIRFLAPAAAFTLGLQDVIHVARRRIKPTYLLNAAPQTLFLGAWALAAWRRRKVTSLQYGEESGLREYADAERHNFNRPAGLGQWDIAPGETLTPNGRELVDEASMESFPASDPPAIGQKNH